MQAAPRYIPRDPSVGPLQPLVREWWPTFVESFEAEGKTVPAFVKKAIQALLVCGDPERGFIRLKCPDCGMEKALAFSCKFRAVCPSCGARRMHDTAHHLVTRVLPDVPLRQYVISPPSEMVGLLAARGNALSTLSRTFVKGIFRGIQNRIGSTRQLHCGCLVFIQRFSKSLGTFPHLHVIGLDGAYVEHDDGALEFLEDTPPTGSDLQALETPVHGRFSRWLRRNGFLEDQETKPEPDDAWWAEAAHAPSGLLTNVNARRTQKWSMDATVRIKAQDKKGREQLLRYACRPPFAQEQIQVLDEERIRFQLRSPMPSGQEEIVFHPIALMQKLAWLVPPPHQHQIRYAGVLAPAARLRPSVVPAGRVAIQGVWFSERDFVAIEPVQYRQSWAVLLARVYDVNSQACMNCSGILRPVGAVTPPQAEEWIRRQRILPLGSRGPPTRQLALAF